MCAFADADWLETVATSRHPSPNHDLCCRLLTHIPLLAAYTGWPTEYHLHVNSQAGTQLFQTPHSNGGIADTEHAYSDVAKSGLESDDQLMKWIPSEEEKKFIEETVMSLVDSEDLCRLLMVAMATELERRTSLEHDGESSSTVYKSLGHTVQASVASSPGDHDHGDIDRPIKHPHPNCLEFCTAQTNSAENVEYGLESSGDSGDVRTGVIVFEDVKFDSCAPSPTNSAPLSAEIAPPPQDFYSGELMGNNSAWFSQTSCHNEPERSPGRFLSTSNTTDAELTNAARTCENTKMIEFKQASHLQAPNNSSDMVDQDQAVYKNTYSESLDWSLIENLESLFIDPKHASATDTSPADRHVQLSVTRQPGTELYPLPPSCTDTGCVNTKAFGGNSDISVTETRRLVDFCNEKNEKRTDRCDHWRNSVKTTIDSQSIEEIKSFTGRSHDAGKSTEKLQSARRPEEFEDECRVTFRPRQRTLIPNPVNRVPTAGSLCPSLNTTSSRAQGLAQSRGRGRGQKSTSHDVKCAARRKTVTV